MKRFLNNKATFISFFFLIFKKKEKKKSSEDSLSFSLFAYTQFAFVSNVTNILLLHFSTCIFFFFMFRVLPGFLWMAFPQSLFIYLFFKRKLLLAFWSLGVKSNNIECIYLFPLLRKKVLNPLCQLSFDFYVNS